MPRAVAISSLANPPEEEPHFNDPTLLLISRVSRPGVLRASKSRSAFAAAKSAVSKFDPEVSSTLAAPWPRA